MPRRCAATTSPTAGAKAATGWSATSHNTPGRSLFVRLQRTRIGKGAAGKWTDAATGEHGDLLDLIALNRGLDRLADALDEARRFLSLPRPTGTRRAASTARRAARSPEAARRLFAMSQPIAGTMADAYLRRARHHGFALQRQPALPSTLLLSPR